MKKGKNLYKRLDICIIMPDGSQNGAQSLASQEGTKTELERKLECLESVFVHGPYDAGGGRYFFEIYFGNHFIGSVIPRMRFAVLSTHKVPENLIPSLKHQLGG